jgi:sodium transport system ATP-binding protein
MIEVQGLCKTFGTVRAVRDVGFSARDGEITGLLGPNGAGKTTTLRMLYTLMKPDAGTISIDGLDAQHDALAVRRRIGVLPDARGLYKRLSARENIEYFAALQGLTPAETRVRCESLIDALDMRALAERRVEGFSQGERVKVAIARALVHDPANVLLDEPTNGLDVMATRGLRDFLRGLKAAGRCVLLSTHVMQEVAALCDRIVIIGGGRVIADGTPDELRGRAGQAQLEDAFLHLIAGADAGADAGASGPVPGGAA